ncbi:hypothetical protein RZS08_52715, partial [Arthrospira platensis SPKY1]|nr:hypothetical protein [Arthrospira platensis SPKY1]
MRKEGTQVERRDDEVKVESKEASAGSGGQGGSGEGGQGEGQGGGAGEGAISDFQGLSEQIGMNLAEHR